MCQEGLTVPAGEDSWVGPPVVNEVLSLPHSHHPAELCSAMWTPAACRLPSVPNLACSKWDRLKNAPLSVFWGSLSIYVSGC